MELRQEEINNLLVDPSFRNWALGLSVQDFEKWENIFVNDSELSQLAHDAKQIIIQIELTEAKQDPEDKASLERLLLKRGNGGIAEYKVHGNEERIRPGRIIFNRLLKIAAVLSFLLVFSGVLYFNTERSSEQSIPVVSETIRKHTQNGQHLTITLPDGSKVKLNSNSSISYPKEFFENRKVELEGEAYFNVVRNESNPFIVRANEFETEVLGTSFNVRAYKNTKAKVSVTSGKVKVSPNSSNGDIHYKILKKEEAIVINNNELKETDFNLDEILWKDGILVFSDESIQSIAVKIQRWFNVTVTVSNDKYILGDFSAKYSNESLEEILEGLGFALNFSFKMEGNRIIINGKK